MIKEYRKILRMIRKAEHENDAALLEELMEEKYRLVEEMEREKSLNKIGRNLKKLCTNIRLFDII